jgi:enoyl-CoA hydratase
MEYTNIKTEQNGAVLTATISRPEVLNALNADTIADIAKLVETVDADDSIRVVVLTGDGEKSFVAGADIKSISQCDKEAGEQLAIAGQTAFTALEESGAIFIAAINGFALGGGCELAMACDIRIASDNAMFGQPEVKLGLIPGYGGTQRLPMLVGQGKAMQLILTGDMIDAAEAYRIGLVQEVYPASELMEKAAKMAGKIARQGPFAVTVCKALIDGSSDTTLLDGLDAEAEMFGQICETGDMKEGTSAFIEKRKPEFTGK